MADSVNCVSSIKNNDSDDDGDDLFAVFDAPGAKEAPLNPHSAVLPPSDTHGSTVVTGSSLDAFQHAQSSVGSVSITDALSKVTASAAASIMTIVQGVSSESPADDIGIIGQGQHRIRAILVKEPKSGINVSRPTKSCEQLPLVFAQYPFHTFTEARRILSRGDAGQSLTIVGVVTRKTDPKQKNGMHAYGVISLWNMQGPFPTSPEEMPILFGSSAFHTHYTKLANGVVLGLSDVRRMESRGGASSSSSSTTTTTAAATSMGNCNNTNSNNSPDSDSQMFKVVTSEQVRILGYATDLGKCQGMQQRTGERCNYMVNSALSKFCSHHAIHLRREARGNVSVTTKAKAQPPCGTSRSSSAHAVIPAGTARLNISALNSAMPAASRGTLQTLARQQQGFLTVKGSCGLPTHSPSASDVSSAGGAYAGVVAGGALPLTGMCRNATRLFNTPTALGVTSRGRAVLAAAVDQEDAKETQRLLHLAMGRHETGVKRTRSESVKNTSTSAVCNKPPTTTTARASSFTSGTARELEAIRAQYAPLTSDASTAFAPMNGGVFNEVLFRRDDYTKTIVTRRSDGTSSALVSTVARQLRSNGVLSNGMATLASEQQGEERQKQPGNTPKPVSLLGVVAESMQSKNDELRKINARQQFEQRMERRLAQDKSLEALSKVTEQKVKGLFCRQCDRWYMKHNERCKVLQHILVAGETTRHFIECEHCCYKTTVLGDTRPSKLIPRCPRCSAGSLWRASNAAPELAAPKEVPPQL